MEKETAPKQAELGRIRARTGKEKRRTEAEEGRDGREEGRDGTGWIGMAWSGKGQERRRR